MVRPLRYYGDDILRAPVQRETDFGEELQRLARDLLDTQARMKGIGLAAVQIGVRRHVFSTDFSSLKRRAKPELLVNARVVETSGSVTDEEGCLSFPGLFAEVTRPKVVVIGAQDLDGNAIEREAKGFCARAFLHEIDHLKGRLFIDLLDPEERSRVAGEMTRIRRSLRDGTCAAIATSVDGVIG